MRCFHTRGNVKLWSGLWVLLAVFVLAPIGQGHPLGVVNTLVLRQLNYSPNLKNQVMAPLQLSVDIIEVILFSHLHKSKRVELRYQRFVAGMLKETMRLKNWLTYLTVVCARWILFVETMSSPLESDTSDSSDTA